jgi:hypothetical protein
VRAIREIAMPADALREIPLWAGVGEELEVGFVLKVDEEGFWGVGESVDWLVGSGDGELVDSTGDKQASTSEALFYACRTGKPGKRNFGSLWLVGSRRESFPSCLPTRTKGRVTWIDSGSRRSDSKVAKTSRFEKKRYF